MTTMKKLSFLTTLFLAVLLLASCSKSVPEYANIVPKDAVFVLRLDGAGIIEACGLSKSDSPFKKKAMRLMKEELNNKQKKLMEDIMDSPSKSGVDVSQPILIYVNPDNRNDEFGVVGGISSAEDFKTLLNAAGDEKVKKSGEVSYFSNGGDQVVIFNDDWFFFTRLGYDENWEPNDPKDKIKEIKKRIDSGKGSLAENEAFRTMCGKGGIMQLMVLGKAIADNADMFDRDARQAIEAADQIGFKFADFAAIMEIDVQRGEASATSELIALKDKAKEQIEKLDELVGGEEEGFYLRMNFGFMKELAKKIGGYEGEQIKTAAKFLKVLEIKYEGNGKGSIRLQTQDDDKTPLEMILDEAAKHM